MIAKMNVICNIMQKKLQLLIYFVNFGVKTFVA